MKKFKLFMAAGLLVLASQVSQADLTPGESELNRTAIQVQRKELVEANMPMDAVTAKNFWPLYDENTEAMKKPSDRFSSLLKDYSLNWMNLSDEKAKSLLDEFFSVREEQLKIKKSFVRKFSKSLPPKIVARFFQIDNKLDTIIAKELADTVPFVH